MKIKVTAKDIKNGKPDRVSMCPIALAVKREFPHKRVFVSGSYIEIGNVMYKCSGGNTFVDKFDSGKKVSPRVFNLREDTDW